MAMPPAGKISLDRLRDLVGRGEIDTIVAAVCDMQGRLIGKRHPCLAARPAGTALTPQPPLPLRSDKGTAC